MAFRGDASQIPLTNIVQTLHLNRQEGVLTVTRGKARRRIRFLPNGVRPVATARDDHELLEIALAKLKIATPAQFRNLLSTWSGDPPHAGDFLVKRHIVSPEEVAERIGRQLHELLLEVFWWENARYEFTVGAPGDDIELFDPEGLGRAIAFPVSGILMEVARRQDEWALLREAVPSEGDVFRLTSQAVPFEPPEGLSQEAYREALTLVDGERSVRGIVAASTLSSFEVHKALAHLRAAGAAEPLDTETLRELADRLRRKFKLAEAADVYLRILETDPEDFDTRHKLILSLEKKAEPEALLPHYRAIAKHAMRKGDLLQAKSALIKLLDLDPEDLEAHFRFSELYRAAGKPKEAVDAARAMIGAAQRRRAYEEAAAFIPSILAAAPEERPLRLECAELLALADRTEQAAVLLVELIGAFAAEGDRPRLKRAYERLAAIDPRRASRFRHLVAERRRRRRVPVGRLVACLAGLAVLAAAGGFVHYELRARSGLHRACAAARERAAAGDRKGALELLEAFRARFPYSLAAERAGAEIERVRRAVLEPAPGPPSAVPGTPAPFHAAPLLARAAAHEARGEWAPALALYEKLADRSLEPAQREAVDAGIERLRKALAGAGALARAAREEEGRGRFEEAWRLYMDLLRRYPQAPIAAQVEIPIVIDAHPPGSAIRVDDRIVGSGSAVVHTPPAQRLRVTVSRPSFVTRDLVISACERPRIAVRLEKEIAWTFNARGPLEGAPCLHDGRLFVGSRSGDVFGVDPATGRAIWRHKIPGLGDVAGSIRRFRDAIYLGSFDECLYVLRARDGRVTGRVRLPEGAAIKTSPSEPSPEGIAAAAAADGRVYGIDLGMGRIVWRYAADRATSPILWKRRVCFGDRTGTVHAVEVARGEAAWTVALTGAFVRDGAVRGGAYFLGSDRGRFWSLDLADGHVIWERDLGAPVASAPAFYEGRVFVGTADGVLWALEGSTGRVAYRVELEEAVRGAPAVYRGRLYCGTGRRVVALDVEDGAILWTHAAGGLIEAPLYAAGGKLFAGSDDHRLIAFSLAGD